MSFDEAFDLLGQDEGFRATIYAMNTLLIGKGVYTTEEFQALFIEHAVNFKNGFRGRNQTKSETSRATVPANL
jgi:hypothetical protein